MRAPSAPRLPARQGRVHLRLAAAIASALALGLAPRAALHAAEPAGVPSSASTPEASGAAPTMASAETVHAEIAVKREALKAEFAELRRRLELAAQAQTYDDRDALLREVDALRQLERVYGQQAALAQIRGEASRERAAVEAELKRLHTSGVAGERPFPFSLLDRTQDELDAETTRLATLDAGVQFAGEALEQARQTLDAAERARRAAQESLETNRDPARRAALENQVRLARLASQVAAEEARLRELEVANEKLSREVHRLRADLLAQQVALISREARLAERELREQTVHIETEEFEVTQQLDKVRRQMMAPTSMAEMAGDDRGARQTQQVLFTALSQRLQQLADLKQLWNRRFALAGGRMQRDDLAEWERDARWQIERADRDERLYTSRLIELRRLTLENGVGEDAGADAAPGDDKNVEERIRVYETALANVEGYRRAQERLLRQLQDVTAHEPLGERVRQGWRMLATAWDYELVAVQDRPITAGKIILGVLLFVAGLWLSRLLSRFLGRRVWPRLGLDPGASAALQSLSYYILVVVMALVALQAVNVPLTLFTFVGGALAIGVGFGSQNIVNNFISGLILLAERPIKVGDLVEIGAMQGTVEGIGARSTRVRSSKNIHVIVPNSHFLEQEVVNWTLQDDSVKTSVAVGVAYGSPTERVRDLLVEAVSHHEKIFTTPPPAVLFQDFAESALTFEVFFWVRIRSTMEKLIIESDVRYRIEQLFREAGIVIAFPQRDVHLEAVGPLEVRVRRE